MFFFSKPGNAWHYFLPFGKNCLYGCPCECMKEFVTSNCLMKKKDEILLCMISREEFAIFSYNQTSYHIPYDQECQE